MNQFQPPQRNRVARPNLNPSCRAGAALTGVARTVRGKAGFASLVDSPVPVLTHGNGGFVRNLAMSCSERLPRLRSQSIKSLSAGQGIVGLRQRGKQDMRGEGRRLLNAPHRVAKEGQQTSAGVAPGPQSNLSSPGGEPGERLSELTACLPTEQVAGAYPATGWMGARRLAEGEAPTERTPEGTPSGLDTHRSCGLLECVCFARGRDATKCWNWRLRNQGVQSRDCSPWVRRQTVESEVLTSGPARGCLASHPTPHVKLSEGWAGLT